MPTVNRTPATVNDPNTPGNTPTAPKKPSIDHDALSLARNKALESQILSEALAELLAELPASPEVEKIQVLANLSERASRETFEGLDALTTGKP